MEDILIAFKLTIDDFMYAVWNRDTFGVIKSNENAVYIHSTSKEILDEKISYIFEQVIKQEQRIVHIFVNNKIPTIENLLRNEGLLIEWTIDEETIVLDREVLPLFDEVYDALVSKELREKNFCKYY